MPRYKTRDETLIPGNWTEPDMRITHKQNWNITRVMSMRILTPGERDESDGLLWAGYWGSDMRDIKSNIRCCQRDLASTYVLRPS